ncbi:MAG: hypothetical protein KF801_10010 [Cryobacterium sp.]|nr:hypothetical protein [Cryobacterium sp.]
MIELHLRGRVAAGRRPDFDAFLAEAVPFYESPGGIRVRVLWDTADSDRFVEVIDYVDQAAHDRDQIRVENDVRMRDLLERWRDLLDGPPVVETYTRDN